MQFFRIVMAVLDSCLPFLYAIAEKGRKDEERTDQEQARAHKRYDGLGNAVLARVHLYVNLESGHNHTNPGDGTTESLDVKLLPRSRASSPAHPHPNCNSRCRFSPELNRG